MYRSEYPRPSFVRTDWKCLNGEWDFCFDDGKWQKIEVPFSFQSKLSGINDNRMCDYVYYRKRVSIDKNWQGKRILLHFGAVDYEASVYVNGSLAGTHTGGNVPFSFDITDLIRIRFDEIEQKAHDTLNMQSARNTKDALIEVRVFDPCEDETIPRGKQFWEKEPASIWYKRTTGIWQSVWLEAVSSQHFTEIRFTPDIDDGTVKIECQTAGYTENTESRLHIHFHGKEIFSGSFQMHKGINSLEINLFGNKIFRTCNHDDGWCWTPEAPNLFDVQAELWADGHCCDQVHTYFGMRKIEVKRGMVYLNNRPYYQKLILDQGYWPDTLMTAKEDGDFIKDIEMAKQMGFNGCRKHQKAEDPRFLYHADRLGFIVWSEIGACASYSMDSSQRTIREWGELIQRDYNHPCIVAWVPLNESWGVPNIRFDKQQQAHSLALYYNIRSMDSTRLIVNNDGWEMTKTDICAIHNYSHGENDDLPKQHLFENTLSSLETIVSSMPTGRQTYADGFSHQGEPVMLTEFGGLAYTEKDSNAWGYTTIKNEEEFAETYARLLNAIQKSEILFGYCYTQLTDVEQEVNGLLTYDREFKVAPDKIKEINDRISKIRVLECV